MTAFQLGWIVLRNFDLFYIFKEGVGGGGRSNPREINSM